MNIDKGKQDTDQNQAQRQIIDGVKIRLIDPVERQRYDQLMISEHYLKSAQLVGEQLRYIIEYEGQWVALMSWSAAAYNLKHREEWIGWTPKQKKRRLSLIANNSRFLILEAFHIPNLASRIMKLCLERLSQDWKSTYGHEILLVESFVDSQRFQGTCYKASGWILLGKTQGYHRARQDFYQAHDRPKQLWMRELHPGARTILRGRNLPKTLSVMEADLPPECPQEPEQLIQMQNFFAAMPDWRERKCDYSVKSLVTVAVCAALCKVCLGQRDLAAFAKNLTPRQMAVLKFPYRGNPRRYKIPGETTFYRLLRNLDNRALEKALLDWQDHVLGKRDPIGDIVAVDGKELLNSQGSKSASAYSVKDGRWLGSEAVAEGSNEIPAVQELLRRADIEGSLVTADALNTQIKTAQIIVQERGADYLFPVKDNQKAVADNAQQLFEGLLHDFSPSKTDAHHSDL